MIKKLKVDELLLFFLSSIFFIVLGFGTDAVFSNKKTQTGLVKYFKFDENVNFPNQGLIDFKSTISVYNSELELWYSIDGGASFALSNPEIQLDQINNTNLTIMPNSFHWRAPNGFNNECKSLVVKVINKKNNSESLPKVLTYFDDNKSALPKLCLTLPESDLFDYNDGIMAFGNEANYNEGFYINWWDRNANYKRRGVNAEKAVFLQYFKKGDLKYEQNCGLKISGNATRSFPQKSMQLVTHQKYGGENFNYSFFGDEGLSEYTSLVIRNSGNDNTKTLFADLLMQNLAVGTDVLLQKGQPITVYINGNYWGIYNLRERISADLIAEYENIKSNEVTILEGGDARLKDGEKSEKNQFDLLISEMRNVDEVDTVFFLTIKKSIDINSFIDYVFFETFYSNNDWPNNNVLFYKVTNGKWKWILQDLDYGLAYGGPDAVKMNLFDKIKKGNSIVSILFGKLIKYEDFKQQFIQRSNEIIENNFSETNINNNWNLLVNIYQPEIQKHIDRWQVFSTQEEWKNNCERNRTFLLDRRKIFINQIVDL